MSKLSKDQKRKLISEIKVLIKGVSKDELSEIFKEAQKKRSTQKKRPTPEKLKANQVKVFIELGISDAMGISEKEFKDLVPIPKDKPGALLVISPKAVSIFAQLNLVGIKNYLDLAKLKDVVETSDQMVYWIYDVEKGTKMLGKSPKTCRALFRKQNRRGLTVAEAIALYIQSPEILKDHYIDISGSCYDSDNVPYLFLRGVRPRLDCLDVDVAGPHCGSASCRN